METNRFSSNLNDVLTFCECSTNSIDILKDIYVFLPSLEKWFRQILVAFSENMNFTNPSHISFLRNKFCLLTHSIDSPLRISYNSWISQILSCSVWHVITISFSLFSYFPRNFRHLTPFPDAWRVTREERISSY